MLGKNITSTWFTLFSFFCFFFILLCGAFGNFQIFPLSLPLSRLLCTDTKRAARYSDLFCYQFYAQIYSRRISLTIPPPFICFATLSLTLTPIVLSVVGRTFKEEERQKNGKESMREKCVYIKIDVIGIFFCCRYHMPFK